MRRDRLCTLAFTSPQIFLLEHAVAIVRPSTRHSRRQDAIAAARRLIQRASPRQARDLIAEHLGVTNLEDCFASTASLVGGARVVSVQRR